MNDVKRFELKVKSITVGISIDRWMDSYRVHFCISIVYRVWDGAAPNWAFRNMELNLSDNLKVDCARHKNRCTSIFVLGKSIFVWLSIW